MSKYGWTLWASIQDATSTQDFDFWAWGMQKYDRAVAEFDGPDFEHLLDAAAQHTGGIPCPTQAPMSDDERRLAELGYKQELHRSWSGFSNFAISFSIISILAGCFTTFGQAWNNGGPIAISWGWPIISTSSS